MSRHDVSPHRARRLTGSRRGASHGRGQREPACCEGIERVLNVWGQTLGRRVLSLLYILAK